MGTREFDLIVIGGGAAGFVAAKLAAGMGKKVAMIERHRLGGECTWSGCVPSKALLRAAKAVHEARSLGRFGMQAPVLQERYDGSLAYARSVVARVYDGHRPESFEHLGITVLHGSPVFIDGRSIELDGRRYGARRFVIATGSRPAVPRIDGIDGVPVHTNATIFEIDAIPRRLAVVGGGPVGVELASAFTRLGSSVVLLHRHGTILNREEPELADRLSTILQAEGLRIMTGCSPVRFMKRDEGIAIVHEGASGSGEIVTDAVLVALGRKPNIEGLGLDAAGVATGPDGIVTDGRMRTSTPDIYAAGDVVGPWRFSHMAEQQAITAVRNAFVPFSRPLDHRSVAWCTFTDPELAHAGMTEAEARALLGEGIDVYRHEFAATDRGLTDGADGLAKIVCDRKGRIVGAHILGPSAGEIVHEAQLARMLGLRLSDLYRMVHIYPTFSEVLKQPAKRAYVDRLRRNPFVAAAVRLLSGKHRP